MASIKLRNPLPMILDCHKTMLQTVKDNGMGENVVSLYEDTINILSAMLSDLEEEEDRVMKFPIRYSKIKN